MTTNSIIPQSNITFSAFGERLPLPELLAKTEQLFNDDSGDIPLDVEESRNDGLGNLATMAQSIQFHDSLETQHDNILLLDDRLNLQKLADISKDNDSIRELGIERYALAQSLFNPES